MARSFAMELARGTRQGKEEGKLWRAIEAYDCTAGRNTGIVLLAKILLAILGRL